MIHAAFSEKPTISVGSKKVPGGKEKKKKEKNIYMHYLHPFIHCCFAVDYKKRPEEKRQGDILSNLLNTCPI